MRTILSFRLLNLSCVVAMAMLLPVSHAAAQSPAAGAKVADARAEAVKRGLDYLREHGQAEDGTFSIQAGSGLTALAVTAAVRNGVSVDDSMVAKGLKALEAVVKPDGGVYSNARIRNYETCVAIVALKLANQDGKYDKTLANADKFVRGLQYGAAGDKDESEQWYGGVGYGGPERPDLSNTAYLVEALAELDAPADDDAIQRAMVFVSRCQNLKGSNDTEFGPLVNDGGFYYVIPTEKVDPSTSDRFTANGGLRSYGSMTYAGFKSMIYAGLTKEDPRVKAALDWIGQHYSVEENPGQGSAGLYYYYHTFAAALYAAKMEELVDDKGQSHDWRKDLVAELVERQQPDGSWANENRQWFENDKNLATAFALIALSYCDSAGD